MQVDGPGSIRNITLAGHGDTGKTTLASALLYTSGVVNRLGRVEDGNATTDYDDVEIARGSSIGAPCAGSARAKLSSSTMCRTRAMSIGMPLRWPCGAEKVRSSA